MELERLRKTKNKEEITMKNVMTKAWKIAREGAKKFGGRAIEYISKALRMAWAIVKKEEEEMNKDVVNGHEITERNYSTNLWEKYGHCRIYTKGHFVYNDEKVNAEKRVSFKGFYDIKKRKMIFQRVNARHEDFIKAVIKEDINSIIKGLNNRVIKDDQGLESEFAYAAFDAAEFN